MASRISAGARMKGATMSIRYSAVQAIVDPQRSRIDHEEPRHVVVGMLPPKGGGLKID